MVDRDVTVTEVLPLVEHHLRDLLAWTPYEQSPDVPAREPLSPDLPARDAVSEDVPSSDPGSSPTDDAPITYGLQPLP